MFSVFIFINQKNQKKDILKEKEKEKEKKNLYVVSMSTVFKKRIINNTSGIGMRDEKIQCQSQTASKKNILCAKKM